MHKQSRVYRHLLVVTLLALGLLAGKVSAAPVDENVIRQVAINYLANHISVHGSWNGEVAPTIAGIQLIVYQGQPVAYNVTVGPSGYLFMAYDDDFSPVLLYSPASFFDPERVGVRDTPESWIIPETYAIYQKLQQHMLGLAARDANVANQERAQSRSSRAWTFFNKSPARFISQSRINPALNNTFSADSSADTAAVVGPLLSTTWNQDSSTYNLYTPSVSGTSGCPHTLTGCVATATAQLMKYWNWPTTGTGSHSYLWASQSQTLSANFNHAYNWSSMSNALTATSTAAQIDAVARLIADVGIADDMGYGCKGSGAYLANVAATVLPAYFKYKSGAQTIKRTSSSNAPAFFSLIKAELDALPPRPMLFQMSTVDKTSAHAVVVDGYQTGTTDMVHINMGWGNANSTNTYYDITNNWTSGGYKWDGTSQIVFTHIEPDYAANCFPAISSTSQWSNAAGLTGSVGVTASFGCPWTASSNASWISITSGASGSGNGTANYSVAANVNTS